LFELRPHSELSSMCSVLSVTCGSDKKLSAPMLSWNPLFLMKHKNCHWLTSLIQYWQ